MNKTIQDMNNYFRMRELKEFFDVAAVIMMG